MTSKMTEESSYGLRDSRDNHKASTALLQDVYVADYIYLFWTIPESLEWSYLIMMDDLFNMFLDSVFK